MNEDIAVAIVVAMDDFIHAAGDNTPVSVADCIETIRRRVPSCAMDDEALTNLIVQHAATNQLPVEFNATKRNRPH